MGPDGHRRLLGITLGPEESENSWSELLEQLLERGLSGVQLVTYYRWRREYGGMKVSQARRLKELERENPGRLKRAVADLTLDKLISRFSNRRRSPRQPNRSIEELPLTFTHNSGLDPLKRDQVQC